jgi:hypothetical protein
LINSVNTETRRKSARTKVASNEIVYLHFQTGNGGIVLDVSAEGLGFQAADPLQALEPLSFRLSFPGAPEIALSGRIAWLDSTRKRGGMRLNVPVESVALFQKWQQKYLDCAAEADEIAASARPNQTPKVASQAASATENRSRASMSNAAAARNEKQSEASAPASQPDSPQSNPPPPPNPFARRADSMLGAHGPIFVSEWEVPPEAPRAGRNVLVACVIIGLCVVIAGGSYYLAGKRAVGNMLINLGQQIGGTNRQTGATGPQSATGAQPAPANPNATSSSAPLSQSAPAPSPSADASPTHVPNTDAPPVPPAATLPPQSQTDAGTANSVAASRTAMPPTPQQENANTTPADAGASTAKLPQTGVHNGAADASAPPPPDAHPLSGSHPASASTQAATNPTVSAGDGGADLNQALQYLQNPDSQDSAAAEQLLWSAISEGNTQADLVLGDLYMRGQGAVRRNCQQAEVLLHAALEANVSGAEGKIQELQTFGCH